MESVEVRALWRVWRCVHCGECRGVCTVESVETHVCTVDIEDNSVVYYVLVRCVCAMYNYV